MMQKTRFSKSLSLILCMVLLAAMALFTTGCSDNTTPTDPETPQKATASNDSQVLGEGDTVFTFSVTDANGNESIFEIHTDKTIVGDALEELGLIAGEAGPYGLYVTTVNGITVDYDTDGKYWAFYIDGEYAMTGVDATEITAGSVYAFKVE